MEGANTDEFFSHLEKHREEDNVVEFYDKFAAGYDKALVEEGYNGITNYSADCLKHFLSQEDGNDIKTMEVIDVGCGSGMTGVSLKRSGFEVFDGVDASDGMIEVSRSKNIYRNLFKGKLTSEEHFDINSNTYDALLCTGCIGAGHISVANAIPEILRLLKHGGIAVYTISPTLNKVDALKEHISYFEEEKCEMLKIERKYFVDQMFGHGTCCHLYVVKKL